MSIDTMGLIANALSAVQVIQNAISINKKPEALKTTQELNISIAQIATNYLTLVNELRTVEEKNKNLETETSNIKELIREVEGYEIHRFKSGALAYSKNIQANGDGGAVYLCANCFTSAKKTYLQPSKDGSSLLCHTHGEIPIISQSRDYLPEPFTII